VKTSILATLAATVAISCANAQAPSKNQMHLDVLNCSALKNQPQVCLVNNTDSQVTNIDCETTGFFGGKGAKGVDVPKGGIPPHSMVIVNMKSCHTSLLFTILGGAERRVDKVNTDTQTMIEVPKQ